MDYPFYGICTFFYEICVGVYYTKMTVQHSTRTPFWIPTLRPFIALFDYDPEARASFIPADDAEESVNRRVAEERKTACRPRA